MNDAQIIWDLEDDPDGNYWHIVVEGHGVTRAEAEEILLDDSLEIEESRSSGRSMKFGWTSTGKHIAVVWEEISEDPRIIYPVTAYPTNPREKRKKR